MPLRAVVTFSIIQARKVSTVHQEDVNALLLKCILVDGRCDGRLSSELQIVVPFPFPSASRLYMGGVSVASRGLNYSEPGVSVGFGVEYIRSGSGIFSPFLKPRTIRLFEVSITGHM